MSFIPPTREPTFPRRDYAPTGPLDCKIALIGEAPGTQEISQGYPFVGPAGKKLDELLRMSGISRSECYLDNCISEQPKPTNQDIVKYIDPKKGISLLGKPHVEALAERLSKVKANIIIGLGAIPLYTLTGKVGISKYRGSILESSLLPGRKVVCTYHPSTLLGEKAVYLNIYDITHDLERAKEESLYPDIRLPAMRLITRPLFHEALSYLKWIKESIKEVDIDIETMRGEVSAFAFAPSPFEAMCIPFVDEGGHYWTPEHECEIWKAIADILEDPSIVKRGQNLIAFDDNFLYNHHGIRVVNVVDIMVKQNIIFPDLKKRLEYVTANYTKIPYYKDEGREWQRKDGNWQQYWEYNCKDAISTALCDPVMNIILSQQHNEETFRRQNALAGPLQFMMAKGVCVDLEGITAAEQSVQREIDAMLNKLYSMCGRELNTRSSAQMIQYFYVEKKIPPYFNRKSKQMRVDDDALMRIARKGVPEAQLIRDIRELQTLHSRYLTVEYDEDKRIRTTYKPAGTKTGRLSSTETVDNTGTNLQNYPDEMKQFLLFDDGYVGYQKDLSQAENRIVAYCGPVLTMIECFEEGKDVHSLTASFMFGIPADEIKQMNDEGVKCMEIGGGRYTHRFWGKKCLFRNAEVLTKEGWIPIASAMERDMEIAQWDKGDISFVQPTAWHTDTYTGDAVILANQRMYHASTPGHKMPIYYSNREKEYLTFTTAGKYPHSGHHFAPLSGRFSGETTIPEQVVRLIVAFQADGSWNGNGMKFHLSKERKIKRLEALLYLCGIPYTRTGGNFYITARNPVVGFIQVLLSKKKLFGPWLLELSQEGLEAFITELPFWDGSFSNNDYFTTVKENAIWAQTVAHLTNRAANIGEQDNSKTSAFGNRIVYRVSIRNSISPASCAINKITMPVMEERIYCPTVPSGFFLCRQEGKISVTGNSNHGLNYGEGYVKFAEVNDIPITEAKGIVNKYHYVYPGVRNGYQAMIKGQLNANRTVVNPLGRHRLYLDRWGEPLFNQAYNNFPQSTVADIIDERGLEYIYNQQDLFALVELMLQVHDSIIFEIPLSVPWIEHAMILQLIDKSLQTPIEWRGREFSIPVDTGMSIGNMGKYHKTKNKQGIYELTRNLTVSTEQLAEELERTYHLLAA